MNSPVVVRLLGDWAATTASRRMPAVIQPKAHNRPTRATRKIFIDMDL